METKGKTCLRRIRRQSEMHMCTMQKCNIGALSGAETEDSNGNQDDMPPPPKRITFTDASSAGDFMDR
jgi:hypothetical protein